MGYKILIVDDSKLARMAVIKALNALHPDWIRVEVSSADEALRSVEQTAPDIALLDFNMPGRSGLDLAAEIRKLKPRMHVAVISANHQQEIIDRAHALGTSFLPKPITEETLRLVLEDAVRQLERTAP